MNDHETHATKTPEGTGGRHPVRVRNLIGICVACLALGLLIWAKLQLVAGVPRTAIATPEDDHPAQTAPHARHAPPVPPIADR